MQALLSSEESDDKELLEDRDTLGRLTRCRSVDSGLAWSSQVPGEGSLPWHVEWSSRGYDYGVIYGHWAIQGLHVARGLRGLDTGCVHHGRGREGFLTAWLPEPSAETNFELPDNRFWQVPARRKYYT